MLEERAGRDFVIRIEWQKETKPDSVSRKYFKSKSSRAERREEVSVLSGR